MRGLANVGAIIGQLYPATLLARLVTLELEEPVYANGRRRVMTLAQLADARVYATTLTALRAADPRPRAGRKQHDASNMRARDENENFSAKPNFNRRGFALHLSGGDDDVELIPVRSGPE